MVVLRRRMAMDAAAVPRETLVPPFDEPRGHPEDRLVASQKTLRRAAPQRRGETQGEEVVSPGIQYCQHAFSCGFAPRPQNRFNRVHCRDLLRREPFAPFRHPFKLDVDIPYRPKRRGHPPELVTQRVHTRWQIWLERAHRRPKTAARHP